MALTAAFIPEAYKCNILWGLFNSHYNTDVLCVQHVITSRHTGPFILTFKGPQIGIRWDKNNHRGKYRGRVGESCMSCVPSCPWICGTLKATGWVLVLWQSGLACCSSCFSRQQLRIGGVSLCPYQKKVRDTKISFEETKWGDPWLDKDSTQKGKDETGRWHKVKMRSQSVKLWSHERDFQLERKSYSMTWKKANEIILKTMEYLYI